LRTRTLFATFFAVAFAASLLTGCGAGGFASSGSPAASSSTSLAGVSSLEIGQSAVCLADDRSVTLSDTALRTKTDGEAGVMATQDGAATLTGVDVVTSGDYSIPLAIGMGGGSITESGGKIVSSGAYSPCLFSAGAITVTEGICKARRSEAAVIEGSSSVSLSDVIVSSQGDDSAVRIFGNGSADVETGTVAHGSFTMSGGSLVYDARAGSLFYVTNSTGVITLSGVEVVAISSALLEAAAGSWGAAGLNGGSAILDANDQTLTGNLIADAFSTLNVTLERGSELTGAIDPERTAKEANLTLDATSTWKVTADSYLTGLTLTGGMAGETISNIVGGGHTVYYDAGSAVNTALGGKTYDLKGGGSLRPAA
jgi:hypothetical protein